MSGDPPNAGDPFALSSSRLGGGPIQARGLKREDLGRLYLTGFAPGYFNTISAWILQR